MQTWYCWCLLGHRRDAGESIVCCRDKAGCGGLPLLFRNHGNEIFLRPFCDLVATNGVGPGLESLISADTASYSLSLGNLSQFTRISPLNYCYDYNALQSQDLRKLKLIQTHALWSNSVRNYDYYFNSNNSIIRIIRALYN